LPLFGTLILKALEVAGVDGRELLNHGSAPLVSGAVKICQFGESPRLVVAGVKPEQFNGTPDASPIRHSLDECQRKLQFLGTDFQVATRAVDWV